MLHVECKLLHMFEAVDINGRKALLENVAWRHLPSCAVNDWETDIMYKIRHHVITAWNLHYMSRLTTHTARHVDDRMILLALFLAD